MPDAIRLSILSIFAYLLSALNIVSAGELIPASQNILAGVPETLLVRRNGFIHFGDMIFKENSDLGAIGGALWPNGIFVYRMDPIISDPGNAKRDAFQNACQAWTVDTPIICRPWTNETDYVLVVEHNGGACGEASGSIVSCSAVGRQSGIQRLHVHSQHWTSAYVLTHEIGHALGFIHEHQRSNRDSYVKINLGNALPGSESQFAAISFASASDYDFDSIMHYDNCAFHRLPCDHTTFGTQTIWPVGCSRDTVGGTTISARDRDTIRLAYTPRPMAAYNNERSQQCGTIDYSKDQIDAQCGSNCQFASALTWIREEIPYDKTCGVPFPEGKGRSMCAAVKKEYITHWIDIDRNSCDLGLKDRIEIWAKCACSRQTLQLSCANLTSKPIPTQLTMLSNSKASREKSFGRNVTRLNALVDKGFIDAGAASLVTRAAIANYRVPGYPWKLGNLLYFSEVTIVRERRRNPTYVLDQVAAKNMISKAKFESSRTP